MGRPTGGDLYDLEEAYIIREISTQQAVMDYGYQKRRDDGDTVQYVEHWTRYSFRITINRQVASFRNKLMEGANQWGFVPLVYFPHIRHARTFYGIPLFAQLLGLAEELNARTAERGVQFIKQLAEMTGLPHAFVHRYATDSKQSLDRDVLVKRCQALDADVGELFVYVEDNSSRQPGQKKKPSP